MQSRRTWLLGTLSCGLLALAGHAQQMPKEDVIEVPAIGEGLSVHNLFQSNMVLQRDRPITIWGWAGAEEALTLTFAGKTLETTAGEDKTWKVTFSALPATATPQTLTVQGADNSLTLENILVGDVWVLGGQSNMEFPLSRIENGDLEIVSANYPEIRILTVPAMDGAEHREGFPRLHEWSGWFSRHFRKGDWDVCSPEIVKELSAIGYVFARRIHMAAKVPVGIVDVSRGGTTVETWTPDAVLREIGTKPVDTVLAEWDQKVAEWDSEQDLANRVENHWKYVERMEKEGKEIPKDRQEPPSDLRPGPAMDQNRPGNCYASMIAPIEGLAVKGAIFHQGYNNCFRGTPGADMYRDVFPHMIESWRAAFEDPEMPFGIISLCTEGTAQNRDNFVELMANVGPYIREAQYQTFLDLYQAGDENIGFTSSYDLRRRWYHPQLKIPAGERMARWALATEYGFENQIRWKPPMITEQAIEDGKIILRFDQQVSGVDNGGPIEGFAVAGEDRRFQPAEATHLQVGEDDRGRPKLDKTALVLHSPLVPKPVHFRYAWARSPMGNLQVQGNTDIPFATQRSDSWPMESIPLGLFGDESPEQLERQQKNQQREALRHDDLKRRLFEAQALIRENETE